MPAAPDIVTDVYLGATLGWTVATGVRDRTTVAIKRGGSDETGQLEAGECSVELPNRDGKWSPQNPRSPYYGLIGRNTPMRLAVRTLRDTFSRTVTDGWGSADTGQAWSVFFGGGSAADFDVAAGVGTMVVSGANQTRSTRLLAAPMRDAEVRASVTVPVNDITGAALVAELHLRYDTVSGAHYTIAASIETTEAIRLMIRHYTDSSSTFTELAVVTTGLTQSAAQTLRLAGQVEGQTIRAKIWAAASPEPRDWMLAVNNDAIGAAGANGLRMWAVGGNTNVPVTVSWDDVEVRVPQFAGEIPEWPKQSTVGGFDATVPVKAAGVTRRLWRPGSPARSALRRWIGGTSPAAYWSLTEGVTSTSAQLTLGSGQPLRRTDLLVNKGVMAPGEGDLASWLEPGVKLTGNVVAGADVNISAASGRIVVDHVQRHGAAPDNTFQLTLYDDDASTSFGIYWNSLTSLTDVGVKFRDGGAQVSDTNASKPGAFDGFAHHYRLDIDQNGADIDWVLYLDGVSIVSHTETNRTLPSFAFVELAFTEAGPTDEISLEHLAIWNTASPPALADAAKAAFGYPGEAAGTRISRLCSEQGVRFAGAGVLANTTPMGPQQVGSFHDLVSGGASADGGYLFEPVGDTALGYRTRISLYNQDPGLALTWGAGRGEVDSLQPTEGDLGLFNRLELARSGGSTVVVEQTDGPNSTQDPPQGAGVVEEQQEANLFSDLVLGDVGHWRVHVATAPQQRYAEVAVNLLALQRDGKDGLAMDAASVGVGDRITVDGLGARLDLPPDLASVLVDGIQVDLSLAEWRIGFNGPPEDPFHIAEVAHPLYVIVGSDTATLNEALDTTETGVDIACGYGRGWVREVNYDIMIGGERMTVTAVSAVAGTFPNETQTLTVTRSVNGIVKTHAIGGRVELFHPAYIGQ